MAAVKQTNKINLKSNIKFVNYILRENSRKVVTWFRYSPWRSIVRYISNFSEHTTWRC